jgi:SAM-dependent methyltransferase
MKESLLAHLVCPSCKGSLELEVEARDQQEIEQGSLRCWPCAAVYPIVRSVPRFVPGDSYVKNFSYQWNVHRTTQVDSIAGHRESKQAFLTKTGFDESELKGTLVLDVGCGTGRFTEIASECGAEVIGIDLSYAVEAAYTNMGRRPGIHIVQADIFKLPFRPATFDNIYSIGVLHHTPSTHGAFGAVTPLLKAGGCIAIWVYTWGGEYSQNLDRVRKVTVHIPRIALYGLCWMLVPLLHGMARLPLLWRIARRIPTSVQGRGLVWDVLDTFDAWAPRYQWKHTESEVRTWFELERLEDIVALSFPVSMRGRKPA